MAATAPRGSPRRSGTGPELGDRGSFNAQHWLLDEAVCRGDHVRVGQYISQNPRVVIDEQRASGKHGLLHKAAQRGHVRVMNMLLEAGAQLSDKGRNGDTPLHLAARAGHAMCVKNMVNHGADHSITNDLGHDAVYYAVYGCAGSVGQVSPSTLVLIHCGADVSSYVKSGKLSQREVDRAYARAATMREINPPSLKTIMTRQKAATGKTLGLGKAVSAENVQSLIDNGVRVHCMLHCIHYLWN
jgi:hypothetical protein